MFDTMKFTMITASICGALLVFLLLKWAGEELFHVGGHYGEQQAYVIDTDEEDVAEAVEEVPFATLMASADLGSGEKVFRKCSACHKLEDGANATGPHLYGVVGRAKASVDGFGYSGALAGLDGEWSIDNLSAFLEKPSAYVAGTSMNFAGLSKPQDRADLIAYLESVAN